MSRKNSGQDFAKAHFQLEITNRKNYKTPKFPEILSSSSLISEQNS